MKSVSFYIAPLFILLWLPSCNVQQIDPGIYQEFSDNKNIILREKEEIILYPDKNRTFEYVFYSNDPAALSYGSGSYSQTGKKLILRFEECLAPQSFVDIISSSDPGEKINYQFKVIESKQDQPLQGIKVVVFDEQDHQITSAFSDQNGLARIDVISQDHPDHFEVSSPVHQKLQQKILLQDSQYLVSLALNYNNKIERGTIMKFQILDVGLDHIALKRNNTEKLFTLKNGQ